MILAAICGIIIGTLVFAYNAAEKGLERTKAELEKVKRTRLVLRPLDSVELAALARGRYCGHCNGNGYLRDGTLCPCTKPKVAARQLAGTLAFRHGVPWAVETEETAGLDRGEKGAA